MWLVEQILKQIIIITNQTLDTGKCQKRKCININMVDLYCVA